MVLQVVLAVLCVGAASGCIVAWRNLRTNVRLADVPADGIERWPSVSIIMPARNEADRIGPALASRLADDYPGLELIVVDDRSTDSTAEVVRAAAAGDTRLRVVRVEALPSGWLGKVHALETGTRVAQGEYLLFSDGDVTVEPGTLRRAVAHCERGGFDCLALVPEYRSASWLVDALWAVFVRTLCLVLVPGKLADPSSRVVVGSGAFNLLRRSAYERTPGFEHLRMDSADDMALAGMVKQAGGQCTAVVGKGCASVRMYESVGAFMRGIEKNGSTTAAKPIASTVGLLFYACLEYAPLLALAVGPTWLRTLGGTAALVQWATNVAIFHATCRLWAPALLWPVGTALFAAGTIRATWLAVIRKGIHWRGTFYPLEELEAGRRYTLG